MAAKTVEPIDAEDQPKTAEAIAKGGHKPSNAPAAGKQPLREPYGKAPAKDEDPSNPARKGG